MSAPGSGMLPFLRQLGREAPCPDSPGHHSAGDSQWRGGGEAGDGTASGAGAARPPGDTTVRESRGWERGLQHSLSAQPFRLSLKVCLY